MLNQNFNEKVVMHSSCLDTISSPCSGVKRTLLERSEDSEYAISTTLVEFEAGSFFDEHIHDSRRRTLCPGRNFSDESGDYAAGTYIRNPHNSKHKPFSKEGCKLFVKLRQFNKTDNKKIIINTNNKPWFPGLVEGLRLCLYIILSMRIQLW